MSDTTRRVIIDVDVSGGQAALREVRGLSEATGNLSSATNDNIRASQAMSNQNVNSTRNFAEQQRGMSGLVRTYAITAANVFALSAAYNVLRENANLDIMIRASEQLSKSTGLNFAQVAAGLRDITGGALGLKDAMQASTLAISGGATTDQLNKIATIATKAALALGRSVPDSVNRMVQAVTKAEPELVDEFGIILRMSVATDEYARSVNKAVSELNTMEKQQAIINQLIAQGESKFKDVTIDGNVNEFDRLATTVQTITQQILGFVSGPLASLFSVFTENSILLVTTLTLIASSLVRTVIPSFHAMGESFTRESTRMVEASARAQTEIGTHYDRVANRINAQRNAVLGNTRVFTDNEAELRSLFSVIPEVANLRTPGRVTTALQTHIDTADIDRQLAAVTSSTQKINVAIHDSIVELTQDSAVNVNRILRTARSEAEAELEALGRPISNARLNFLQLSTDIGQSMHSAVGSIADFGSRLSTVFGAAFSAETTAGALDAVHAIRINMDRAGESASGFAGVWARATNAIVTGAGYVAVGIRGIGAAFNTIFPAVAILVAIGSGVSALIDYFDLIPEKSKEASAKLSELTDGFEKLQDSVTSASERLKENATTMQELVDKYSLLGNKTREIAGKIKEGLDVLKNIGGGAFQNTIGMKLLGLDTGTKQLDAFKNIIKTVKELEKLGGKPIDLVVNFKGQSIDLRGSLDKLTGLNDEAKLAIEQKVNFEIDKYNKNIIAIEGSAKDAKDAVQALNKSWADQTTQFRHSNPLVAQIEHMETLIRVYQQFSKESRDVEAELAIIEGLSPEKAASIGLDVSKAPELTTITKVSNLIQELRKDAQTPGTRFQLFDQLISSGKLSLDNLKNIKQVIEDIREAKTIDDKGLRNLVSAVLADREKIPLGDSEKTVQAAIVLQKDQLTEELKAKSAIAAIEAEIAVASQKAKEGNTEELKRQLLLEKDLLNIKIEQIDAHIKEKESEKVGLSVDPDKNKFQEISLLTDLQNLAAQRNSLVVQLKQYTDSVIDQNTKVSRYSEELRKTSPQLEVLKRQLEVEEGIAARSTGKAARARANKDIPILQAKIKELTENTLAISIKQEESTSNIAKETGNLVGISTSALNIEKLRTDQSNLQIKSLKDKREELKRFTEDQDLALSKKDFAASRAEKEAGILSGASANEKFDPTFRSKILTIENSKNKEALFLRLSEIDTYIQEKELRLSKSKDMLDGIEIQKEEENIGNKKLEREALLLSYSEKQLDSARKQNEIDKLLVDKGLKDFNATFSTSMAIAAQDFSKSLGTSVDRVVKQVIGTIDTTLDTTFSNAQAFLTGAKTGKEALAGVQQDLSAFFISSATQDAKNSIKEALLSSFSGTFDQFATPQEKTNNWLEKIYNELAGTVGINKALGAQPGSSKGIGGDVFNGIGNFFGTIGDKISDAAGGIGDFFSNIKWHASGGIVSQPSIIGAGEAGAEAVIPLAGGAVPVVLSGMEGGSIEATKALIAVSIKMRDIVGNGDEQIAALQGTNIAINTMSKEIVNQLIISTSQIINSLSGVSEKTGWNSLASGLLAVSSLVSAAAGAYSSAASGSADTSVSSDYGSFSGGTSDAAYADGGVVDRPTRALIGEGRNSEAVVPLPNNRSIPVQFNGKGSMASDHPINISVNVLGVRDEGGLNRSANQIALESARAAQRALRRDG